MSDTAIRTGACHCGAVRFEAEMAVGDVLSCNCSYCSKRASLLAFVPAAAFRVTAGEDRLKEYRFNRNIIAHLFCDTCGIEAFARGVAPSGAKIAAINVRCLDGVEIETLNVKHFDGRHAM